MNASSLTSRRQSRQAALQILFQMEVSKTTAEQALASYWPSFADSEACRPFADTLVLGVAEHRDALDDAIRQASQHWRLERMPHVDRNILRLAAYELLHLDEIPKRVTLNEAIELAKEFGAEGSTAFVNGVLDHLARDLNKA